MSLLFLTGQFRIQKLLCRYMHVFVIPDLGWAKWIQTEGSVISEMCRVVPDYQDITHSDCMVYGDQMNWQICIG